MQPTKLDFTKFSFKEMFNDNNGKSSGGIFCGVVMVLCSCLCLLYSVVVKYSEGINASIAFAALGAGLLGIRRFTKDKEITTVDADGSTEKKKETTTD